MIRHESMLLQNEYCRVKRVNKSDYRENWIYKEGTNHAKIIGSNVKPSVMKVIIQFDYLSFGGFIWIVKAIKIIKKILRQSDTKQNKKA